MEKTPTLEQVDRLAPSDYDQFGFPLEAGEREETTGGVYDECIDTFFKKMNRFNTLLKQWKTMPDYDPDQKVDLPWLEERLGAKGPEEYEKTKGGLPKREDVSDEQVDAEFYEDCAKGFFKRMARFNELMAHWKTLPDYDANLKVDLGWLEDNVASRMQPVCPFHPLSPLKILNPDAESGPVYYSCHDCPVWCTSNTVDTVLPELKAHIHPEVLAKLEELTCQCGLKPRMKLSQSEKNPRKVYLTCGQNPRETDTCGYFQWMHGPLWRPKNKSLHLTLDRWRTSAPVGSKRPLPPANWVKTPVGDYFGQKKPRPFAGGFKPPVFGETPKPIKKSFEDLCDEQNAERAKYNMAPYSYDTYRRYGLGIF